MLFVFFQLTELGLECTFVLNGLLQPDIEKLVADNRDQLVEAGKHRAAVSSCIPFLIVFSVLLWNLFL
jgi:hypothetical protein